MYKLKKRYKGHVVSTGGNAIDLDSVKSSQVEILGLQDYFEKEKKDKKS
ncbi:MAG: hypothetical protein Unbinned4585contig1001_34 [Prokaryotic dsDNA virus sp.]|nr:MAG: hypothetical protein Unbinned4585contig1001_34 [Prokaryotic dsDNA virus sp.]|tara:strand:+ start:1261 stop:1407 length:147 start_codon:yes stop_codon:yes gene_type:complete